MSDFLWLAALLAALGLIAWKVPQARAIAIVAIAGIIFLLTAGKLGGGILAGARDAARGRRAVADAKDKHRAETEKRNEERAEDQAESDAAVAEAKADTTEGLDTKPAVDEEDRKRRSLGDPWG